VVEFGGSDACVEADLCGLASGVHGRIERPKSAADGASQLFPNRQTRIAAGTADAPPEGYSSRAEAHASPAPRLAGGQEAGPTPLTLAEDPQIPNEAFGPQQTNEPPKRGLVASCSVVDVRS
jgi:hypothetical protein